jgi:stress response protein YsnF
VSTPTDQPDEGRDAAGVDNAMTRAEERLVVGSETVVAGRAQLRKLVVEDEVRHTAVLRFERARLVRTPLGDADRDRFPSGVALSEDDYEIVLRAERPVVTRQTVPVERAALDVETVAGEQQVHGTVRREELELTTVDDPRPDTQVQ